MGDVLLTVCDGERVLHEGHLYDPGESFKIEDGRNADTLIASGIAEKGKGKPTDKGPLADDGSGDSGAPASTSGDEPVKVKDLKAKIAADDSYTDQELADLLEKEQAASSPRESVTKAIGAEQKRRADAADAS